MKLYGYFRSSAAYRVRIALNLKKLPYDHQSVHLTRDGGWQWSEEFRAINPQKRVPALALSTGEVLLQSLAIIEYLDEVHPEPPLLPADAIERAQVRAFAQIIALRHPSAEQPGGAELPQGAAQARAGGSRRLVSPLGDAGLRRARSADPARPLRVRRAMSTLADSAWCRRCSTRAGSRSTWRNIRRSSRVDAACQKLPAFDKARPENQPDAE